MTKSDDKKVPALRFKGFTDDWEQRKFESLIYPEKIKNKNNLQLRAYSISNKNGFIAQTDQFGKDNTYSKADKKTNYIVNPGAFAYNPARINIGSIGYQNLATPVLVSSLYEVFKTNSQIKDLFLIYWFKTDKFFNQIKKYEEGGVRQYYFLDKLLFSEIIIPKDVREQQKISKILKKLDYLISLQQRKLEQLNLLKKGLLQKIFSDNDFRPNLRFKNFNEKWKQHKLGSIVHWSKGNHLKKSTLNSKYDGYEVIHYADLYKFKPVLSKVIHWSRNNTGTIIPANSLLFPMSDVTPDGLARTTAMMKNGVRAGSDILIATVKNNNAEFLSYQINLYSKRIVPLVTGTTIRHINSKALSTLNIKIPTNSEQNIISKLFIFFENFVDLQQSKINQLKLLKKFILNNMFI